MTTTILPIDAAFFEQLQFAADCVNDLKQFEHCKQKMKLYLQFEDKTKGLAYILIQYEDTNQIFYLGWHYFKEIKLVP